MQIVFNNTYSGPKNRLYLPFAKLMFSWNSGLEIPATQTFSRIEAIINPLPANIQFRHIYFGPRCFRKID